MSLIAYKQKRNFRRTPEPVGKRAAHRRWSYVIQKHAASHLHYDFRLELDGVLKSWAVPKGPCLDPSQKRLAVHVEDHPVKYGGFEGIIPQGEYGGGTVLLWDRGHWEPEGDPQQGYQNGKLKFKLHGDKLSGGWMLIRRASKGSQDERTWFLVKRRDTTSQSLEEGDILEEQPLSVVSGRDLSEIAGDADRVWGADGSRKGAGRKRTAGKQRPVKRRAKAGTKSKASLRNMPTRVAPQLATLASAAPPGDEWLHEIKFDGYRMLCRIDGERVEFISRNERDWTKRLSPLVEAVQGLSIQQAIFDGEVVVENPQGVTDFQLLQNVFREGNAGALRYYLFDLLFLDGDRKLTYAGKVGTGFSDRTLEDLGSRLEEMTQSKSPFADLKRASGEGRGAHWVKPQLVAQVAFSNWTRDQHLRHPSFQGLREDKLAREVVREEPVSLAEADIKANGKAKEGKRREVPADFRLTHPEKLLYPEDKITKFDLAKYYAEIAEWILPHIVDRPLALVRCPEGRHKQCFYQKHPGLGTPKSLRTVSIKEKSKTGSYVVVDDLAGLLALVQVSTLEIHAWGSHAEKLERPDRLVFDLDPDPAVSWRRVIEAARQIRQFLQDLGLESFVKTTGGKGLHLVAPIMRRHDWDEAKDFTRQVAGAIVAADPRSFTSNMSKAARSGKIYIDYLRNGRGAMAVAPYSTRAKAGAPISTPLSWDELTPSIHSDEFRLGNLPQRLAALKRDPWEGIFSLRQSITAAAKKTLHAL